MNTNTTKTLAELEAEAKAAKQALNEKREALVAEPCSLSLERDN